MKISILATTIGTLLLPVRFLAEPSKGHSGAGEAIFHERCVGCHGLDGRAQTELGKKVGAADLTSDAVQQQRDSQLLVIVKEGKGKMPALGDKLSDDEIHAVIIHIRQLAKNRL